MDVQLKDLPLNDSNLPYPDPLHPIVVHFVIAMVFFCFFSAILLAIFFVNRIYMK